MNKETQYLAKQLEIAYQGEPWFGRATSELLAEVDINTALYKTDDDQHSILELVYHMINWREFTISRLQPDASKDMKYFEKNDWIKLDHGDDTVWEKGLAQLEASQKELLRLLNGLPDEKLSEMVEDRQYNFRFLLNGIIQHDIYHLGQIAYIKKYVAVLKTNSV